MGVNDGMISGTSFCGFSINDIVLNFVFQSLYSHGQTPSPHMLDQLCILRLRLPNCVHIVSQHVLHISTIIRELSTQNYYMWSKNILVWCSSTYLVPWGCKWDSYLSTCLSTRNDFFLWIKISTKCLYYIYIYTECPRRNVPDFGRVFLMLKYTDITQNTCIQSWMVTEIMAREKWGLLAVPNTATCTAHTSRDNANVLDSGMQCSLCLRDALRSQPCYVTAGLSHV